jgi:C1A family cysteine protease
MSCSNCNIQNSNPSIGENTTKTRKDRANKVDITKRYNPAALLNSNLNTNTSSSISSVINVASQVGFQADKISTQKKKTISNVNQATLIALKGIVDTASSEIQVKETKTKIKKTAKNIAQTTIMEDKKKDNVFKPKPRRQIRLNSIKKNTNFEMKKTDQKKSKTKSKRAKSVGTDLASSPSFIAKFNSLLKQNIEKEKMKIDFDVPRSFNGKKVWKNYIREARSQGLCGSCWAFASLFVLQTRLSIYSKGKYNYNLSPAKMIFCSITDKSYEEDFIDGLKNNMRQGNYYDFKKDIVNNNKILDVTYGCEGQNLINAWQFLYRFGSPENSCFLYGDESEFENNETPDLTSTDNVPDACSIYARNTYDFCPSSKRNMTTHRSGGFYFVPGAKSTIEGRESGTEYNIRKEIYKWGPCTTGIMIYKDFLDWDGRGIYVYDGRSEKIGGHAVVLMGWGEENGRLFWLVLNSWGTDWGKNDGYFKVLRGVNHCEIEENVIVGVPNIPAIRLFLDYPLLYQKEDLVGQILWKINDNGIKETTYENLSLGKIKNGEKQSYYSIKSLPNFYEFIAGNVSSNENYVVQEDYNDIMVIKKRHDSFKKDVIPSKIKIALIFILIIIFFYI